MVSSTLNSNLELTLPEVAVVFFYWSLRTNLLISPRSKHQLNSVLFFVQQLHIKCIQARYTNSNTP